MIVSFSQLAFIGPGGPEFLVVMLVLLLMFGAKDAPRIFRKLNELLNQMRHTADSFKREVMYGDLQDDANPAPDESGYDVEDHDEDYDFAEAFQDEEDSDRTPEEPDDDLIPGEEDSDARKA